MVHLNHSFPDFENHDNDKGCFLTSFQRKSLLRHLQTDLKPKYRWRLEIMLMADAGQSQTQICETLGCSQEMARYWITIAKAGLAHQWQDQPMGRPKTINDQYLHRLRELVNHSPRHYGYSFQQWTAQWLSQHLAQELGIKISDRHINRLLKQMGLSTRKSCNPAQTSPCEDTGITISDLPATAEPNFYWSLEQIKTHY